MDYNDYGRIMPIAKNRLDDEFEMHAEVQLHIGEEMAKFSARKDEAKESLARVDAEIYQEVAARDERLSDAKILREVVRDDRHIRAHQLYVAATRELARWTNLYDSWRSRGYMLRSLADLWISNYYAPDSESSSGKTDALHRKGREALNQARRSSYPVATPEQRQQQYAEKEAEHQRVPSASRRPLT